MILFLSDGRLGNQLYQVAFLQSIAKEGESIYCFRMGQFKRSFENDNPLLKCIEFSRFSWAIYRFILQPILTVLVGMRIFHSIRQDKKEGVPQPSYSGQKGLLPIKVVQTAFFQSTQLFNLKKVSFQLKKEFQHKTEKLWQAFPKGVEPIFIHVRRGDYAQERYLGQHEIMLPKTYFDKGIQRITEKVERPFFIFLSDDPDFIEEAFKNIEPKFVSRNEMEVDLALMMKCEYGIISNSSFSAWGAYLMQKRRQVIAPKYWFGWKIKKESHPGIQPPFAEIIDPNL